MVRWTVIFLVVALVATVFGFSSIAGTANNNAWVLFVLFLILFLTSLIMARRSPV